ncbi:MAG: AarF/ABC1/UbiB kinase family protein [Deltaproteobacteria bacterium]|nr:AarF/ABC1/UbiB kinase family protein [Deltaproteobacteria bacterium]MBW2354706.1 AarF/ABC1/UbiB kinase family protein [Deltaproteobacteria bacterium]HDZ90443.1 AarF/ABC1/UbiB kinase family protein [Deltaproteobacteria bacterium]
MDEYPASRPMDSAAAFVEITRPVQGRRPTVALMRKRALGFLKEAVAIGALEDMVRQVVLNTGLQDLLPRRYDRFRMVVVEGMVFMISSLPLSRLALSTPHMTVMTRVDGTKITGVAHLTMKQRRRLASGLARICILRPIQDMREESIFHGDPHAGNISYTFEGTQPRTIFYDWGMLGRLKRLERLSMVLLTLGLVMGNRKLIFYTADIITRRQLSGNTTMTRKIMDIIDEAITGQKEREGGLLSSIEFLFERFTYEGVVFSRDLLMYEKALVTLKGVLADVDPTFNRDEYMVWAAMTTFLNDVVRLRLMRLLIRDAWNLYRGSISIIWDLQKVIAWFLLDAARLWRRVSGRFSKGISPG